MPARPPARAPAHPLARSTHKRRQLFWDAYSKLATRATAAAGDGKGACALRYSATAHEVAAGEGTAEIVELTKRQRGLVTGGGVEILGRKLRKRFGVIGRYAGGEFRTHRATKRGHGLPI